MATKDNKIANQIFREVWESLEREYGQENLCFPKEIMWLGGAPGAGKGTNTPFIMRERGLTAPPIVMSALLNTPEMEAIKDQGHLVGDREVIGLLLRELLKPEYESGVVVDGFPRTHIQVISVRNLHQKMMDLRREFFNTRNGPKFRRPVFRVTILYVSEQVSIDRQLGRGREIMEHNRRVEETGVGEKLDLRATDIDEEKARERYKVFMKASYAALESLRDIFHYHLLDANGPVVEVEKRIMADFRYQSSLELGEDTADSLRNIPIATDLSVHARQELVRRLDSYRHRHAHRFNQVINLIEQQMVPVFWQHANVGRARIRIEHPLLEHAEAISMIIDVLTERGYYPVVEVDEKTIPISVDLSNGAIMNARRKIWAFEIRFPATSIRSHGQVHLG
ncbi:MAG: nucleoside monophosphate kinase [Planctomycetota bacterium]